MFHTEELATNTRRSIQHLVTTVTWHPEVSLNFGGDKVTQGGPPSAVLYLYLSAQCYESSSVRGTVVLCVYDDS